MNLSKQISVQSRIKSLLTSTAIIAAAYTGAAVVPSNAQMAVAVMLSTPSPCGLVVGGVVTCNGDGAPATDANPFTNGISYFATGNLDLTIDGTTTPITVISPMVSGVRAGVGSGTLTINTLGKVSISAGHPKLMSYSGNADGINASIRGIAAGTININTDATIMTNGNGGVGIRAFSGVGTTNINMTGGSINSNNSSASGIYVQAGRGDGIQPFIGKFADINVAGNIDINGSDGYGIYLSAYDSPGGATSLPTASINIMQGG